MQYILKTIFYNVNLLEKNPNKWTRKIHVNSIAASSFGSPAFRSSRRQDILRGISWFSTVPPNFELIYKIWGLLFHGREYDDRCLLGCDVVLTGKMGPCFICNAALIISEPRNKKIRNSTNNSYKNNYIQKYVVLFTLQYIFLPPFIIQSVHYKTTSTTYVVEPKILHYLVYALQSNIQMNILQSYVHMSVNWYLRISGC
jgi:hypothetical protein